MTYLPPGPAPQAATVAVILEVPSGESEDGGLIATSRVMARLGWFLPAHNHDPAAFVAPYCSRWLPSAPVVVNRANLIGR